MNIFKGTGMVGSGNMYRSGNHSTRVINWGQCAIISV